MPKPLVDYPDEEDDDIPDATSSENTSPTGKVTPTSDSEKENTGGSKGGNKKLQPSPDLKDDGQQPPERLAEKRRRQGDEEEDELDKLSTGVKRRNSTSSSSSLASTSSLRRKKGFLRSKQAGEHSGSPEENTDGKKTRKIAINISTGSKGDERTGEKPSDATRSRNR